MLSLLPQAPAAQDAAAGTQTIGEFITTGGVMMWPILGCSVIVVGLAIERTLALQKARIVPAAMHDAIEQVCQGRASAVADQIAESDAPAGRVLAAGMRRQGFAVNEVEKAMEDQAAKEGARLRGNVRGVALMASVAPLLGLLGTVLGIARSFGAAKVSGVGYNADALASGIGVALHTTILGLMVAVPATLIAAHLMSRVRKLMLYLDDAVAPVVHHLAARPEAPPAPQQEQTHAA
jgi:biopolymer transport protein ExbB